MKYFELDKVLNSDSQPAVLGPKMSTKLVVLGITSHKKR